MFIKRFFQTLFCLMLFWSLWIFLLSDPVAADINDLNSIFFEKLASVPRTQEPVEIAVPFPHGYLTDPQMFKFYDNQKLIPAQLKITARWPDGSIKWMFVRTLVDLPADAGKTFCWKIEDTPVIQTAQPVKIEETNDGYKIDTGALQVVVPKSGFFPFRDVRFHGKRLWTNEPFQGFVIKGNSAEFCSSEAKTEITVVEPGPICVILRIDGFHSGPDCPFDLRAYLTFWAGKPYVSLDYQILYVRDGDEDFPIQNWRFVLTPQAKSFKPLLRLGYGYYRTHVDESRDSLRYDYDAERFKREGIEHCMQSFTGDLWCDWQGANGGVTITQQGAQQNLPTSVKMIPEQILFELYPSSPEPLSFPFGAAKTQRFLFHFHADKADAHDLSVRSLQFHIPDIPRLPSAWYAQCNVWDEEVFVGPRSRRIEAIVYDILDNRPSGMGILNFGDEVEWGYTSQGRGRGDVVWLNNEYDFSHLLFVQFARTGVRRFLDYARANSLHWRDVDIVHASTDSLRLGGHISHSARHTTGGVSVSHQWVEGLLDAYHFFDDADAYKAALGIGENILRWTMHPRYRRPGLTSTRDLGWALRALLALYKETGDKKYLTPCQRIIRLFLEWQQMRPGFLAPYTDHANVRVNFMNALTVVSLYRYYRLFPEPELKALILAEVDDMITNGLTANDLPYYKELPSLKRQGASGLFLQALSVGYRVTRDKKYLRVGLPSLEYILVNLNLRIFIHSGAAEKFTHRDGAYERVMYYPPGGKIMGTNLMPMLEFLHAAHDTDLAQQVDFKLILD